MFTGIVTATGAIRRLTSRGGDAQLEVATAMALDDVRIGDSIAVNGACLTVTALADGGFTADVSAETLSRTTLKDVRTGFPVNLEKALRLGDRLGGHLVLGHVDGVGRVSELTAVGQSLRLGVEIDGSLARYVVEKGSIAVDGVSLTVNRCEKSRFYVNMIPTTAAVTTLGKKKKSDSVNIETDILGRYVERLLAEGAIPAGGATAQGGDGIDATFLAKYGFMK
ncbi:MAG: riboflavin synthase [Deltaproteobacteria bacterium]|nr:riboflavin synthase [Deltaproteobacteria bacterium]